MREEFERQIQYLADRLESYSLSWDHIIPEMMLHHYLSDVMEQATAVAILVDSDVPRTAFTNVRSAFEAAQDAALLATSGSDYDWWGAVARVADILERHDLLRRFNKAIHAIGTHAEITAKSPEEIIAEEADDWDRERAGHGEFLRRALTHLTAKSGLWKRHWSGMSRPHVAQELHVRMAGEAIGPMLDAQYGLLSLHAHPKPRVGMRGAKKEDGEVTFGIREIDRDTAVKIGYGALMLATYALQERDRLLGFPS